VSYLESKGIFLSAMFSTPLIDLVPNDRVASPKQLEALQAFFKAQQISKLEDLGAYLKKFLR
jgi:hypothetical protein